MIDNVGFNDEETDYDNVHRFPPQRFNAHLIGLIQQYWSSKGYAVRVWGEKLKIRGKASVFTIKSDMINGKPPESSRVSLPQESKTLSPPLSVKDFR